MKIHISQIDDLCRVLSAGRIPSNYSDESQEEQQYYADNEYFLIERSDGTPMTINYLGLIFNCEAEEKDDKSFKTY